jgi:hypothetical protein
VQMTAATAGERAFVVEQVAHLIHGSITVTLPATVTASGGEICLRPDHSFVVFHAGKLTLPGNAATIQITLAQNKQRAGL